MPPEQPEQPEDPKTRREVDYKRPTMPWERDAEMDSSKLRLAGAGIEMVAVIGLFVAAGWWADANWGWHPWGKVVLSLLGVALGMYLLVRQALASAAKENEKEQEHKQ